MAPRKGTSLTVTWRLQQLDRGSTASSSPRTCASKTPLLRPRPSTAARPHGNSSSRSQSQFKLRSHYGVDELDELLIPARTARRAAHEGFFFFHSKHRANPSVRSGLTVFPRFFAFLRARAVFSFCYVAKLVFWTASRLLGRSINCVSVVGY